MEFQELQEFIRSVLVFISNSGYLRKSFYFDYLSPKSRSTKFRNWKLILETGYIAPYNRSFIGEDVFKLSKRGKRLLSNAGVEYVGAAHPLHFDHDDVAIQFALACQQSKLILPNWQLERSLRCEIQNSTNINSISRDRKIPDLVFEIPLPKNSIRVALEVERTRKSKPRYDSFIHAYAHEKSIDLVLVTYSDESIRNHLRTSMQRLHYPQNQKPILFCKLKDLRLNPTHFEVCFDEHRLSFSNYVQNLQSLSTSPAPEDKDSQSDERSQL